MTEFATIESQDVQNLGITTNTVTDSKVEIIDSFGRVVKSIESLRAINYSIDIQELAVGNYIIRNINNSGSSIQKFSKTK